MAQFWEGENMTVDSRRKLAFMSRDARPEGSYHHRPQGPVAPVDHRLPEGLPGPHVDLPQRLPLHVVGRRRRSRRRAAAPSKSSAVSVTDMRDAMHPFTYAALVRGRRPSHGRQRQSTHSVDVDFDGVAWVSGSGGVRGCWTEGLHKDPATGTGPLRDAV